MKEIVLNTFSAREVQARVRAGESADAVAASTGWDLAKVVRYAEPLLAERAFIAQQATTVEVRRSGGVATLFDTTSAAIGDAADALIWDSFRREDGRWVVTATTPAGAVAAWTYDHHGRNLHPLDDLAREFMGVTRPQPDVDLADLDIAAALDLAAEVPVVREDAVTRPRLVAVPTAPDDEAHGSAADDEAHESAADDEAQASAADEDVAGGATAESDAMRVTSAYEQETIAIPRDPAPTPNAAEPGKPARKPRARKGRASIPSWDEILFGAGRSED